MKDAVDIVHLAKLETAWLSIPLNYINFPVSDTHNCPRAKLPPFRLFHLLVIFLMVFSGVTHSERNCQSCCAAIAGRVGEGISHKHPLNRDRHDEAVYNVSSSWKFGRVTIGT